MKISKNKYTYTYILFTTFFLLLLLLDGQPYVRKLSIILVFLILKRVH
jgi:hypothetical protein